MQQSQLPVFIFGVSGATWKVLDPMMKAGRLPNFQRLCEEGSYGTLLSMRSEGDKHYRPQVAWPTIATGCSPSKHGVTRFFHTAKDLEVQPVWDIYQEHGHRVGLYGWPMTWPPQEVDGFVIPSHHGRDSQTWPPELSSIKALDRGQQSAERDGKSTSPLDSLQLLTKIYRNGLQPGTILSLAPLVGQLLTSKSAEEKSLLLRHAKLEISTDFFLKLFRQYQPTFSSFVTFLVDLSSHRCWSYYEPDKYSDSSPPPSSPWLRHAVEYAYERVDRCLGRILSAIPSNSVVAFVSEHGMSPEPISAEVGSRRYVIQGNKLKELVGLSESLEACPVARWFAFRPTPGTQVTADMADRFRNITVAETGLPLFQVYHHQDEVIVKFQINRDVPTYRDGDLEDLNIIYEDKKVPFLEIARRLGPRRSAMHDGEGVFILRGQGIKRNYHIPNCNLIDIAPTLLRASNISSQNEFEGNILDIFTQ